MYNKNSCKPKVLLIGNGINRAYKFGSWDDLIQSIKTKTLTKEEEDSIKKIPYPLQPVILTGDELGDKMKDISYELVELKAPVEEESLLKRFVYMPFDTILTTNYTYELEKAIEPQFECKVGRRCKFRKKTDVKAGTDTTSLLHTYFKVAENTPSIWHIHGEAAKPNTMILGHYYYGKLLSKIQQYITTLKRRVSGTKGIDQDFKYLSWIDYFMLSDIYIVGLGLSPSEFDLWWLINCKKRHFPETKIVFYKPDITIEERLLAEAYRMEVKSDGLKNKDYKSYYNFVLKQLELYI